MIIASFSHIADRLHFVFSFDEASGSLSQMMTKVPLRLQTPFMIFLPPDRPPQRKSVYQPDTHFLTFKESEMTEDGTLKRRG